MFDHHHWTIKCQRSNKRINFPRFNSRSEHSTRKTSPSGERKMALPENEGFPLKGRNEVWKKRLGRVFTRYRFSRGVFSITKKSGGILGPLGWNGFRNWMPFSHSLLLSPAVKRSSLANTPSLFSLLVFYQLSINVALFHSQLNYWFIAWGSPIVPRLFSLLAKRTTHPVVVL